MKSNIQHCCIWGSPQIKKKFAGKDIIVSAFKDTSKLSIWQQYTLFRIINEHCLNMLSIYNMYAHVRMYIYVSSTLNQHLDVPFL